MRKILSFSAILPLVLSGSFLAGLPASASAPAHPYDSGTTSITIAGTTALMSHPSYAQSYQGYTVFDYYKCDVAPTFASASDRLLTYTPTAPSGQQEWRISGSTSSPGATIGSSAGTNCIYISSGGSSLSLTQSESGKYIVAASRTSLMVSGNVYFYAAFSNGLLYSAPLSGNYSTSGWLTNFTVTNSIASQSDGGLVISANWSHALAQLQDNGSTPSSGRLELENRGPMFCDSAQVIALMTTYAAPQGCWVGNNAQGTPAPVDTVSGTGAGNSIATTWTIPASVVAGFDSRYTFFGLRYQFRDSQGDLRWVFSPLVSIGSSMQVASGGSGAGGSSNAPKYSGPEFSSFGAATLAGTKLVTSGKKLDTITSMKINGTAVTYKINSASELEIDLPKDLAPGKYDVEINSIHGKLTHLQGITIKAVVPTKELAFKAEGAWLNYGSLLELTNIAKQIGSEYTSVKCIVNSADPVVAERLAKRACSYIEANRLRGKAVTFESKSTYKGEGFWVRVVANG